MLRQMQNDKNSITHRLPPEILATVASHLDDDKSLIAATRVCYFWRSILLSSHCLWTHLTFKNELRALVFLERSKSAPISVDLTGLRRGPSQVVKESLKGIKNRLAVLRAEHGQFLEELLVQPLPILKSLDLVSLGGFPLVASLAPTNLFRLTNFCFELKCLPGPPTTPRVGDQLLNFLRNCPLLEVAFFSYGNPRADLEFTTDGAPIEATSLPLLRSFTHESPFDTIRLGLLNRLSLPPTCDIALKITDGYRKCITYPWGRGFPLRGQSYLSDVKMAKITFHAYDRENIMISTTFFNSVHRKVSLNTLTLKNVNPYSAFIVEKILDFFGGSEMAGSVETLHFERCPSPSGGGPILDFSEQLHKLNRLKTLVLWQCDPEFFLGDPSTSSVWCHRVENLLVSSPSPSPCQSIESHVLERVRAIVVSRKNHGTPFKSVSLYFGEAETLSQGSLIEVLRSCAESVNVFRSSSWRVYKVIGLVS